jgi:hypothetical protein
MEKVFPLRTAPSQMMASHRCRRHQVRTFFCLGENRVISAVLPPPLPRLRPAPGTGPQALFSAVQQPPSFRTRPGPPA